MDEKDLVKRIVEGDPQAFKELIQQHQRLVSHMIGRLIDNDLDREELCQDVFIKVYDHIGKFKFDSKLSTWIATIAYRMAINFLKKHKRRPESANLDEVTFVTDTAANSLEDEDYAKFINTLIDQMPVKYKTVLTLFHIDGFTYPEIVEIMDMPEGTVKNYLFRARQKLKELSEPLIGKELHSL